MTITSEITIDKPVQAVWDFTDNEHNLGKWLQGFQRWELVSGERGKPGQVANQHYEERGRQFILQETILEMNPPHHSKLALYHKTMESVIDMRFDDVDGKTKASLVCDIQLKGIWKILGPLSKKTFQKRQDDDFARLKAAVESE